MLSALDESFLHQVALPFELAATSDHRFFDRTMVTAGAPDGSAGVILGMGVYKNMNVVDGFAAVQVGRRWQHNLRLSRPLRPDLSPVLGPLRIEVTEPLAALRVVLEPGMAGFDFDLRFRKILAPVLEEPHQHRADGRMTQDYVRFNQLMRATGRLTIDGRTIEAEDWFAWRDHSWGVRPSVGGFEPPSPQVTDAFPSAARAGGKGMMLFYVGLEAEDGIAGGVQVIEDGLGGPIYMTGHFGPPDRQSPVVGYEWSVETYPGTRAPRRLAVTARTADGAVYEIVAVPSGQPWGYRGFGYDGGYDDGRGQGVWRGPGLLCEQDRYDISDVEEILLPGGARARPAHREVHVAVRVNGCAGHGYMPFIAIGDIARLHARPGG